MRTKVFLFTALVMNCLTGFSQKYLWNSQFGIADTETSAKSMAIDTDNNAYLTGNFTGAEMTIGNKEVTGASMVMDAYVAKFTPNNQCVFASSIKSSSGSILVQSIAADASGNSFVAGNFESDAEITETLKIESDYKDFFIAKYDATGNPLWLKGTTSGIEPVIKSIAVNPNDGSFAITGAFTGNLNIEMNGGEHEISSGNSELAFFIAKYDNNANLIWAKTMSGNGTGTGNLISIDEKGDIYAVGTFSGTIQFETQSMTAASVENTDNFLVKYAADGSMAWARSLKGSKLDDINAMDVANHQVVIGGVIRSEDLAVDNAPGILMKTLDTTGTWNSMLIISFDTDGNYQWNYIAGSSNQPTDVKTIAIEKDGSIWNAGTTFGTYYFNPDAEDEAKQFPSKAKGGQDMYLMKLSSKGEVLIGHRVGDATKERAMAMAVGNEGILYVADMVSTRSGATASPVNLFGADHWYCIQCRPIVLSADLRHTCHPAECSARNSIQPNNQCRKCKWRCRIYIILRHTPRRVHPKPDYRGTKWNKHRHRKLSDCRLYERCRWKYGICRVPSQRLYRYRIRRLPAGGSQGMGRPRRYRDINRHIQLPGNDIRPFRQTGKTRAFARQRTLFSGKRYLYSSNGRQHLRQTVRIQGKRLLILTHGENARCNVRASLSL